MSSSKTREGTTIDTDSSTEQSAPRLRLTRETVKSLRIKSGCQTGLFNVGNAGIIVIKTRVAGQCTG